MARPILPNSGCSRSSETATYCGERVLLTPARHHGPRWRLKRSSRRRPLPKAKAAASLVGTTPDMAMVRTGADALRFTGRASLRALALTEPPPFLDAAFRVSTASAAAIVARQSGWKRCGEQAGQFGGRGEEMIVAPRQSNRPSPKYRLRYCRAATIISSPRPPNWPACSPQRFHPDCRATMAAAEAVETRKAASRKGGGSVSAKALSDARPVKRSASAPVAPSPCLAKLRPSSPQPSLWSRSPPARTLQAPARAVVPSCEKARAFATISRGC